MLSSRLSRAAVCVLWLAACGRDSTADDAAGGAPSAAPLGGSSSSAGSPSGGLPSGGLPSGGSASEPPAASGGGAGGAQTAGTSTTGGASAGTGGAAVAGGGTSATEAGSAGQMGGGGGSGNGGTAPYEPISFGTKLDPSVQMAQSKELANALADPSSPTWRAKGDQRRTYRFDQAGADVRYRLCVPNDWDGTSPLPLVMFLHGSGNDESSYLDQNGKQMVQLAAEHGYVLVSPLGYGGAYGNFLRLNASFAEPEEAAKLLAKRTEADEKTQQLSEKDVINVLELVLREYPIERSRMFLTGHSMGSGGTWYIGGKYSTYWAALAPMSGPFVLEDGYPWPSLRGKPLLVTEGLAAPSLNSSRALRDWLKEQGFTVTYEEVQADHAGMVPLVLPRVFSFFDRTE